MQVRYQLRHSPEQSEPHKLGPDYLQVRSERLPHHGTRDTIKRGNPRKTELYIHPRAKGDNSVVRQAEVIRGSCRIAMKKSKDSLCQAAENSLA